MKTETKQRIVVAVIGVAFCFCVAVLLLDLDAVRYTVISHGGRIVRVNVRSGEFWVMTDKGWQQYTNSSTQ